MANIENTLWSACENSAEELPIGSKLFSQNGIIISKISSELWEYKTSFNTISYNNCSIDNFKTIEAIEFNVESA